jgi:tocopherol O-methyltransferase
VQAELATQRAAQVGCARRVRFEVGDANQLGYAAGEFDVVWSVECTEHLFDKARFCARCAEILRPGGKVAFAAWLAASSSTGDRELLGRICGAMLCPSLGTGEEYLEWLQQAGFAAIRREDVSARVAKTWTLAEDIVARPEVQLLLRATNRATRDFAAAIPLMADAYATGAMRYGLFAATKAGA